jgi:hypothetical protein
MAKKKKKAKKAKERAVKAKVAKGMEAAAEVVPPSIATEALASSGDTDMVHDAYKDSLKKTIQAYFTICESNKQEAEGVLVNGLKILREARDNALQIV